VARIENVHFTADIVGILLVRLMIVDDRFVWDLLNQSGAERWRRNTEDHVAIRELSNKIGLL